MITYTIHYKEDKLFSRWNKLKNVKGDGVTETNSHRFFILEDESRIELPLTWGFKFSRERFYLIQQRMSEEAGQDVKINKR